MAKKPHKTSEQQEYRDNLAPKTKTSKQCEATGKDLKKALLEKEKEEKNQYIQKEIEEIIQEEGYSSDGEGYFWTLIERCKDGTLNKDTAKKLIDAGYIKVLSYLLKKFEKLDNEIADIILNSEYWYHVVGNLEVFEGVDHNQLALKLLKEKRNRNLSENLCKFKGLSKEIAKAWLDSNYYTENILHHLDSFVGLDKEVLLKLERNSSRLYVSDDEKSRSLKLFSGLDKEVAMMILKDNYYIPASCIVENINQFEGLDKKVADKLIEEGYGDFVAQHPEKFGLKKEK